MYIQSCRLPNDQLNAPPPQAYEVSASGAVVLNRLHYYLPGLPRDDTQFVPSDPHLICIQTDLGYS